MPSPTTIHATPEWATSITADVNAAQHAITLAALSANAPTGRRAGPWPALWNALCAAAQRGVTTRLILPTTQKAHPATWNNLRTATAAAKKGMQVVLINGPHLWHAKCCVVDDFAAWIGSGNLTDAATVRNVEFWTRTENPETVEAIRRAIHDAAGIQYKPHPHSTTTTKPTEDRNP